MRIGRVATGNRVGLVGSGRFWCLYCEGEHGYQLRAWRRARLGLATIVPWLPPEFLTFVRCDACQATFDPECLEGSSTKSCAELMVNVPEFAWGPAQVPSWETPPEDQAPEDEVPAEYRRDG